MTSKLREAINKALGSLHSAVGYSSLRGSHDDKFRETQAKIDVALDAHEQEEAAWWAAVRERLEQARKLNRNHNGGTLHTDWIEDHLDKALALIPPAPVAEPYSFEKGMAGPLGRMPPDECPECLGEGCELAATDEIPHSCRVCHGTGKKPSPEKCARCGGSKVVISNGHDPHEEDCPDCGGGDRR